MLKTKVAIVKGSNHYQNITRVLRLLEKDLAWKISRAQNIIIKPNFVSTTNQLAATNIDAVRATLDFLRKYTNCQILIAEHAAFSSTAIGFTNFGYVALPKQYHIKLVDLAKDEFIPVEISDIFGEKTEIGIGKTILNSDFRISVTPAKTHDEVIVTLGIKNMVMGSLNKRPLMHQGPRVFNLNLAKLAKIIPSHLSIIDGTVGMEGNGPIEGKPIASNFTVASLDQVAADVVATQVMGFNPKDIGYLHFLGIPKNIEVIGETIAKCQVHFTPHRSLARQLKWKEEPTLAKKIFNTILTKVYLKVQEMPFYSSTWFGKIKEPVKKILGY